MDLSLMLDVPDACDHLPAFQIASYLLLDCDFEFTSEFCKRLSQVLTPYHMVSIVHKLSIDPDWSQFRVSPDFTLPSTHEELRQRLSPTQKESSEELCGDTDPVCCVEDIPVVEPLLSESHIDSVVACDVPFCVDQVSESHIDSVVACDVPLCVDQVKENPSLVSRRAIRSRLRSARYHAKIDRIVEYQQSKYKSTDFHAGKRRGNYSYAMPLSLGPNGFIEDNVVQDVYALSAVQLMRKPYKRVIYAPPCSGKSTYNADGQFFDTDYMPAWNTLCPEDVITNMPHLLKRGVVSIAIIPTRSEFDARCRRRGLSPLPTWYDDMLRDCDCASVKLYTNNYLADISHPLLEPTGRKSSI